VATPARVIFAQSSCRPKMPAARIFSPPMILRVADERLPVHRASSCV
jgi:hypothetical protein